MTMRSQKKSQFLCILILVLLPFGSHACNPTNFPGIEQVPRTEPPPEYDTEEYYDGSMSVEAYIINGKSSAPAEFPHQVSLHPRASNETFCGGSIISPYLILTAAHCLEDHLAGNIKVTAGLTDMSLYGMESAQTRNAEYIYFHEKYEGWSLLNDIAIIQLDLPFEYNEHVKSISLPSANETFEGVATVTGWGLTERENNQSYSNILKKAKLHIVPIEKCKKVYEKSPFPVTEYNLCAGVRGSGMCNGDSGGPAICKGSGIPETSDGISHYIICGIVSFGYKCGKSPGVCTRVASYIDWIEQAENELKVVRKLSENGIKTSNKKLETPLHKAVDLMDQSIALKVIKILIGMGVDVSAQDLKGYTFLHRAVDYESNISTKQFKDMAGYLVSRNLSNLFNIGENSLGRTPLMLAARNVELDVATILLLGRNGVDLTLLDINGSSYLLYAAEGNKNAKLLLDLAKNGSIKHNNLAEAIEDMDVDSVKLLVKLGADLEGENDKLETPLHLAAASTNKSFAINIIKFLIHSGADVYAQDRYNRTFLHRLVIHGPTISPTQFHDMVVFLISKDLPGLFNIPDRWHLTPFQEAVNRVDIETATLSLLKNNDVDFNTVDSTGWSVLFYATLRNRTSKLISDLVDLGADPKHLTKYNRSNEACSMKRLKMVIWNY